MLQPQRWQLHCASCSIFLQAAALAHALCMAQHFFPSCGVVTALHGRAAAFSWCSVGNCVANRAVAFHGGRWKAKKQKQSTCAALPLVSGVPRPCFLCRSFASRAVEFFRATVCFSSCHGFFSGCSIGDFLAHECVGNCVANRAVAFHGGRWKAKKQKQSTCAALPLVSGVPRPCFPCRSFASRAVEFFCAMVCLSSCRGFFSGCSIGNFLAHECSPLIRSDCQMCCKSCCGFCRSEATNLQCLSTNVLRLFTFFVGEGGYRQKPKNNQPVRHFCWCLGCGSHVLCAVALCLILWHLSAFAAVWHIVSRCLSSYRGIPPRLQHW